MCIAIAKPAGTYISRDTLWECWTSNPDGAGFAYIKEGAVYIDKFMTFELFYKAYKEIDGAYGQDAPMLVHFRITSRGATRLDQCHPFQINRQMAFIHNGTISSMPISQDGYSDTYLFNEMVLKKLPKRWETNPAITMLIEDMIGFSKLCVLHATKGIIIYNEKKGVWDSGIWYSNTSYKPSSYYRGGSFNRNTDEYIEEWWKEWESQQADSYKGKVTVIPPKTASNLDKLRAIVFVPLAYQEEQDGVLIRCAYCLEYHHPLDLYSVQDSTGTMFICETCVDSADALGVGLNYVALSDDDMTDWFDLMIDSDETSIIQDTTEQRLLTC